MIAKIGRRAITPTSAGVTIEDHGRIHARAFAGQRLWRQGVAAGVLAPLRTITRLALPSRCGGCSVPVEDDHRFCEACWSALRFLGRPWCAGCNTPFAFDRGADARCASCLAAPPLHAGVRAAVAYGDVARILALRLKYGGRIAFADTMAKHMVRLMPTGAQLLVPVPLHRGRLWTRGYNQAALIAEELARLSGVADDRVSLVRMRGTTMLRGLGARQRGQAVAGAFVVSKQRRDRIKGRSVVLIDDVYTTGATANACTRALLAGGASSVTVLCWARVLKEGVDD